MPKSEKEIIPYNHHRFQFPSLNRFDKFLMAVAPTVALKRLKARVVVNNAKRYHGASVARKSMSEWVTYSGDADTDLTSDVAKLRERSRDLVRNNCLATGALNTKVSSVIGSGMILQSRIDKNILGLTDDQANDWESRVEAYFKTWSESQNCDLSRTQTFAGIQELVFRSVLEAGDVFVLTPMQPLKKNTTWPFMLRLQLVEADRVCNKDNVSDSPTLVMGIEKNEDGEPVSYHITKGHPGNYLTKTTEWDVVPAYGKKTGRKNVIHLFHKKRVGQTRGIPDLAPVIEELKQLGRYTESEIASAVISSFFTVFVKTEYPSGLGLMQPVDDIGGKSSDQDFKMGSAAILDLNPNEDVEFANPGRPNQAFDGFVLALCRQIGTALELPFELLVKHFTSSYSASRAALIEAWRYFMGRRKWLSDNFLNVVYELFLDELVSFGYVDAPGYFSDPLIRKAYLGAEWIGPTKGQIDELKSVMAAKERINVGISTISEETAALTGGDWETNHRQRAIEAEKRKADGLQQDLNQSLTGGNNDGMVQNQS